jgi:hypothetical protein
VKENTFRTWDPNRKYRLLRISTPCIYVLANNSSWMEAVGAIIGDALKGSMAKLRPPHHALGGFPGPACKFEFSRR